MNISRKQKEEIDFLSKIENISPTKDEIETYVNYTVKGISKDKTNILFQAKRKLDIMIKMWREDLTTGLISVDELKEDFKSEYFNKLIDSVIKGVTKE